MSLFKKIISGGANELIESVGGVLDNLTTTKEEKLQAKQKLTELVQNHQAKIENEITQRHANDMNSDSWLSKNVRPMTLIFIVVCTVLLIFIDAGKIEFTVKESFVGLLEMTLITIIGFYFGSRGIEKFKK
jgi:hypothetical protein|tara:strand:- start:465 stop:857 length:393 start_codon:yes stop_codon:yes gene_type:complete